MMRAGWSTYFCLVLLIMKGATITLLPCDDRSPLHEEDSHNQHTLDVNTLLAELEQPASERLQPLLFPALPFTIWYLGANKKREFITLGYQWDWDLRPVLDKERSSLTQRLEQYRNSRLFHPSHRLVNLTATKMGVEYFCNYIHSFPRPQ